MAADVTADDIERVPAHIREQIPGLLKEARAARTAARRVTKKIEALGYNTSRHPSLAIPGRPGDLDFELMERVGMGKLWDLYIDLRGDE